MNKIDSFRGRYFFLSNFYTSRIELDGFIFKNAEAAFQSYKTENPKQREFFTHLDPSDAKKAGRRVLLRKDWERIKEEVMYKVVFAKFSQNRAFIYELLSTGEAELIEGNDWGDRIWGTVNGKGKNLLGKILMKVRKELQDREDLKDAKFNSTLDNADEFRFIGRNLNEEK